MSLATLQRLRRTHSQTTGLLRIGNLELVTLEPPEEYEGQRNIPNKCCIPEGEYQLVPLARSASGKYREVFWVKGVEGREGILIHNGNIVDHTQGCILVGMEKGMLMNKEAVLASREARDLLWKAQPTTLLITAELSLEPTATPRTWKAIFSDFVTWLRNFLKGNPND